MGNGTRTSLTVYESQCETQTLNLSLSLGLEYNRLSVPVILCSHNLKHGPGTQRAWGTVVQGHNGTDTQRAWGTMVHSHNGIGTQWD